jgi:hypothetical protein
MILYTFMPEHLIFQSAEEDYLKQKIVYCNGIPLVVKETETQEYEIIRNLSTNPQHFLEQKYSPGTRLPQSLIKWQ